MREREVPQDPSFYQGHERICFAVGDDERYVPTTSSGWEVERVATEQALLELEAEVEALRRRVLSGEASSLAYHVAAHQMTPRLCAQHVGLSTWRVKRHLSPRGFRKLSPELLARYARCLDMRVEELHGVPQRPTRVFFEEALEEPLEEGRG